MYLKARHQILQRICDKNRKNSTKTFGHTNQGRITCGGDDGHATNIFQIDVNERNNWNLQYIGRICRIRPPEIASII